MSESVKAILGLLAILSALGILFVWVLVWAIPDIPTTPTIWALRYGFPIICIVTCGLLYRESRRKDLAPDFLRDFFGIPFERDGACFYIRTAVRDGTFFLDIVVQNQYASPCDLRLCVAPPFRSFTLGKRPFPGVSLDIACDGGVLAVVHSPLGIPSKYQGRETRFEIAAATHYPVGRGTLLRVRNGIRVGKIHPSALGSFALTAGMLMTGQLHFIAMARPKTLTLRPPVGVVEEVDPSEESTMEILWKPGDSTDDVGDRLSQALAV